MQAEHLCRQAEAFRPLRNRKAKGKLGAPVVAQPSSHEIGIDGPNQATLLPALRTVLEETFGFKLTVRTLTYILKRLDEFGYTEQPQVLFQKIFIENRLEEFRTIFREVLNREAFEDNSKKTVDVINAANFALLDEIQGKRVAQEKLRSVLRWRKGRSRW